MTCFLDCCVSSICHHATPWVEPFTSHALSSPSSRSPRSSCSLFWPLHYSSSSPRWVLFSQSWLCFFLSSLLDCPVRRRQGWCGEYTVVSQHPHQQSPCFLSISCPLHACRGSTSRWYSDLFLCTFLRGALCRLWRVTEGRAWGFNRWGCRTGRERLIYFFPHPFSDP